MNCVTLKRLLLAALMIGITNAAWAQQSPAPAPAPNAEHSTRYRTIFTSVGAGGGFALGVFTGLAMFDDSTNSDRKVWTTAIIGAAGGGVGGYFLGRVLDRHRDRSNPNFSTQRKVDITPFLSKENKGLRLSVSF